jgi:CDP-diacylglycerol--glycerol-3-phosphate 3-phosphatidyltransferase
MYRQVPNALTLFRLVLAAVFFIILNQYRYGSHESTADHTWLIISFFLFILAAITDWLDGFLARKWKVETTFGRIMDPFCDKVLVLGAFIYLSGPRFVIPQAVEQHDFLTMITGIYPWMVVLMLARELLVTSIRGEMESQGVKFGAKLSGKLKTTCQLVVIPAVILLVWCDPKQPGHAWMAYVRDVLVYACVVITIISGLPYVTAAVRAMKKLPEGP